MMARTRREFQFGTAAGAALLAGCTELGLGGEEEWQRAIGAPTPQSGPLEPSGVAGLRGMRVALDELDDDTEFVTEDGEAAPDQAISVFRDMVEDNVPVVTGTFSSDVSNALSDQAEEDEVPFMTAISVDPAITGPDDEYTFRMTGDTTQKLKGVAEFLEAEGISGLSVIAADYSMGRSAVEFMENRAGDYGMSLEHQAVVPLQTDNFVPELAQIDTDAVDALFTPFPGGNGPTLVSQIREQGLFDELDIVLGHDSYGTELFLDALGEDLVDMYFWGVDLENERAGAADEQMREMFDVRMDSLSLPNYDAVRMIGEVMASVDSVTPQNIRDGLADIEYETASGWDVSFDESGDNESYRMVVSQWEEGEDRPVSQVQFTSDVVTTE